MQKPAPFACVGSSSKMTFARTHEIQFADYDREPSYATSRKAWADKHRVGHMVSTHRQVLNDCENLLVHLVGNPQALNALSACFRSPAFIVGLRAALSDAIEESDSAV